MATADQYADWIIKNKDRQGTPEFQTVADAYKIARGSEQPQPELTQTEKLRTSPAGRFARGMFQPAIGAAEFITSPMGEFGRNIRNYWGEEAQNQEALNERANVGTDVAGFAGEMLSPVNAVIAAKGANLATGIGRLANKGYQAGSKVTGATIGAEIGATQRAEGEDYGLEKLGQIAGGAVGGAVMTPIMNKIAGNVINRIQSVKKSKSITPDEIERSIQKALSDEQLNYGTFAPEHIETLKNEVKKALGKGQQMDMAARLRQMEFEKAGIPSLKGQVTRDPLQYGTEMNLRAQSDEIMNTLTEQNRKLSEGLSKFGKDAEENAYRLGEIAKTELNKIDEGLRKNVSSLYENAKKSEGAELLLPTKILEERYNSTLKNYGKGNIPKPIRDAFSEILKKSRQAEIKKPYRTYMQIEEPRVFTFRNSNTLQNLINDHYGKDKTVNSALDRLRQGLRDNISSVEPTGGVFAPALKAASDRFKLHDMIPALKDLSRGKMKGDKFFDKYVLGADTKDVIEMSNLLKRESPELFNALKSNLGKYIHDSAFGSSDKFKPAGLEKFLSKQNSDKLKAFFSPDELDEIYLLSRVGGYANKFPANTTVGTSNTAIAAGLDKASLIPGLSAPAMIAKRLMNEAAIGGKTRDAISRDIPTQEAINELTPEQQQLLSRILRGGGVLGGVGGVSSINP